MNRVEFIGVTCKGAVVSYLLIRCDCSCVAYTDRICLKYFLIAWDYTSNYLFAFLIFFCVSAFAGCFCAFFPFFFFFLSPLHLLLFLASLSLFPTVIALFFYPHLPLSCRPYFHALPPCSVSPDHYFLLFHH